MLKENCVAHREDVVPGGLALETMIAGVGVYMIMCLAHTLYFWVG